MPINEIDCIINGERFTIALHLEGWSWSHKTKDILPIGYRGTLAEGDYVESAGEALEDAIDYLDDMDDPCAVCGDRHWADEVPFSCQTGDGE